MHGISREKIYRHFVVNVHLHGLVDFCSFEGIDIQLYVLISVINLCCVLVKIASNLQNMGGDIIM